MSTYRITTHWSEYTTIASMSCLQFIASIILSKEFPELVERHHAKITKMGKAMPYKIGIALLQGQAEGKNYFEGFKFSP